MAEQDRSDNIAPLPLPPKRVKTSTERVKRFRAKKRARRAGVSLVSAPRVSPVSMATAPEPHTVTAGQVVAVIAAVTLTAVAACFSVSGMTEIFPGAPVAIVALAATMEMAKLVIAGWLAANWSMTGRMLRSVLVAVVAGLAVLNAAGVYGRLVEAHLGVTVAATASVAERVEALDARITEQAHTVAGIDAQIDQIDSAVGKLTDRGSPRTALAMAEQQRKDSRRPGCDSTASGRRPGRAAHQPRRAGRREGSRRGCDWPGALPCHHGGRGDGDRRALADPADGVVL